MVRTGLKFWSRLAFTLMALVWSGLGVQSAAAMGCHVPERPVLGLAQPWEDTRPFELTIAAGDASPPSYVPVPCDGEAPTSIERVVSPAPVAALRPRSEPAAVGGRALVRREPRLAPLRFATRIDRPPRLPRA